MEKFRVFGPLQWVGVVHGGFEENCQKVSNSVGNLRPGEGLCIEDLGTFDDQGAREYFLPETIERELRKSVVDKFGKGADKNFAFVELGNNNYLLYRKFDERR